ncbi:MAG: diguanylate cyclase, partial [Syntrophobacteria bacterium]
MEYKDLHYFLQHVGKDPSRLIFEDELTAIYNRRFLLNYLQYKIPWDALESQGVALLMMDVDHFKNINDSHGHQIGDQTLIWIAKLLKQAAGEKGLPIRYAGDEFMILIPGEGKQTALEVAKRLLQRLNEEPMRIGDGTGELYITLSIGVAVAREDAQSGRDLIHQADAALYYAKKAGRNQVASAGEFTLQDVFSKTALHQMQKRTIAGRRTQLAKVSEALKKFSQGHNQFLIVEGSAGMGKSEFLQTIRQNLVQSKIPQVAVNGSHQEFFRPYYLTCNILLELLNQKPDKGTEILETLTPREISYLSHVLPQLGEADTYEQEDEKTRREGIFTTLLYFFPKLVPSSALILLIDDLHFTDEATLLLLRQLLLRQNMSLFICTTSTNTRQEKPEGQPCPLERFYSSYCQELNISKVTLTPLAAVDIAEHLQGIFPQVKLAESFEKELAQITQGNPLFLAEIVRKLILDGKITLVGQQWTIEPIEDGYLPRSLEEIISQKIAGLDEESRTLLDQSCAFGEN